MQAHSRKGHVGIVVKHRRGCTSRNGGRCNCQPSYQAAVWSARDKRRIRKEFPTLAAAKAWRQDAQVGLRNGTVRAPTGTTLGLAADTWIDGAKDGSIRNRSGDAYKPSAIRSYEHALKSRILPMLGRDVKLSAIARADVQRLVERLHAEGSDASTIRNTVMPLRAIYRRAVRLGEVAVNPTSDLDLPAVRGKRDRIASPEEAARLITAVPERDRALWATAMYAGLRLGELRALRWEDVDLATGRIKVVRSWDREAGVIEPKSRSGRRTVPVAGVLRDYLDEHRLRAGRDSGLVFIARTSDGPFDPSTVNAAARKAWEDAELEPITLHESRHTFASMMIAAGVNAKALSTFMGHASISITLDRYGHLMPGSEDEAAGLLDTYLARAASRVRVAQEAVQEPQVERESAF